MDQPTIFFAWQSDRPLSFCRRYIRDALDDAVVRIGSELSTEDAPRLISDTTGISGTPSIIETVFSRISRSVLFVGDVTFTGVGERQEPDVRKLFPNPNVLIELGFAAHVLGWDRVICVMNDYFGDPSSLSFDLRHRRWPIAFRVGPESATVGSSSMKKKLADSLVEAIRSGLMAENERVLVSLRKLDKKALLCIKGWGAMDAFNVRSGWFNGMPFGDMEHRGAVRLIDLELIHCDTAPKEGLYAYHWTPLGKEVARRLGYRGPG